MSELGLTTWQRRRLLRQLRQTRDVPVYRRTLAVLEVDRGTPISRIAQILGVTRQSIYNWIDDYLREHDPVALADEPRTGRPSFWTEDSRSLLRYLLERSPNEFGYPNVNWTVPLLREPLERCIDLGLSEDTIRRELHRMKYVWKRPRYVLEPDPEREKKTADPPGNPPIAAPVGQALRG